MKIRKSSINDLYDKSHITLLQREADSENYPSFPMILVSTTPIDVPVARYSNVVDLPMGIVTEVILSIGLTLLPLMENSRG